MLPALLTPPGIESPGLTAGPAIGEHLAELVVEKLSPEKMRHIVPVVKSLSRSGQ